MHPILIAISIVIALVGIYLLNWYVRLVTQLPRYKRYWDNLATAPVPKGAIKIVALGDSLMQGMGADRPKEGLFGRIVDYVQSETGRPVAANNISKVGAKAADVVVGQLPDLPQADLYVVTIGSNDSNRMSNIAAFKESVNTILQQLPANKTIIADIGFVGHRAPYQAIIKEARERYGVRGATLERSKFTQTTFREKMRFLAKDFFHPSSYGYIFWFEAFRPAMDDLIVQHKLAK